MASKQRGQSLYISTLLVELIPAVARGIVAFLFSIIVLGIVFIVSVIVLTFKGQIAGPDAWSSTIAVSRSSLALTLSFVIGAVYALYPIAISLLAFFFPWWDFFSTHLSLEGEPLSEREAAVVREAEIHLLEDAPATFELPTDYYVIDYPVPLAFDLGTTVYLTRNLISSSFLQPVLAHVLGHLNCSDAKLSLALRSLTLSWWQWLRGERRQSNAGTLTSLARTNVRGLLLVGAAKTATSLVSLSGGGAGQSILKGQWEAYWQERDYVADQFAADCGQAIGLIEYLEHYKLSEFAIPFIVAAEPSSESRINLLRRWAKEAPGTIHSETMRALPPATAAEQTIIPVAAPHQPAQISRPRKKTSVYIVAGVILFIVIGAYGAITISNNVRSSFTGEWVMVDFCNPQGCSDIPHVRFGENILVRSLKSGTYAPKDITFILESRKFATRENDEDAAYVVYATSASSGGGTVNLDLVNQTNFTSMPYLESNSFQVSYAGDILVLQSRKHTVEFMLKAQWEALRNTLKGKWKGSSGDTLEFTDVFFVENGQRKGTYNILRDSYLQQNAYGATSPEVVQYRINDDTLTITDSGKGTLQYTRDTTPSKATFNTRLSDKLIGNWKPVDKSEFGILTFTEDGFVSQVGHGNRRPEALDPYDLSSRAPDILLFDTDQQGELVYTIQLEGNTLKLTYNLAGNQYTESYKHSD